MLITCSSSRSNEAGFFQKALLISLTSLAEFEGNYKTDSGEIRRIRQHEDKLVVLRSSGPPLPLLGEAPNKFYFAHDQMTTFSFLRDSTEEVVAHVVSQAFDHDTAWSVE